MRFEWDESKNEENLRKHGLDFADAQEVFELPTLVAVDKREANGEDRYLAIGFLRHLVSFLFLWNTMMIQSE